jgi:hypothetical protein
MRAASKLRMALLRLSSCVCNAAMPNKITWRETSAPNCRGNGPFVRPVVR